MPAPALFARQRHLHSPLGAVLKRRLCHAALVLGACAASGLAQAGAPAMVVVQPTLSVVEPAQAHAHATAPVPVHDALGVAGRPAASTLVVLEASALAATSDTAETPAGAPDAAATPWLQAKAAPGHAAELPRSALAGLPVVAMLIGAALVVMGWRRARR